jgi:hypothetical protein
MWFYESCLKMHDKGATQSQVLAGPNKTVAKATVRRQLDLISHIHGKAPTLKTTT